MSRDIYRRQELINLDSYISPDLEKQCYRLRWAIKNIMEIVTQTYIYIACRKDIFIANIYEHAF